MYGLIINKRNISINRYYTHWNSCAILTYPRCVRMTL